MGLAEYTGIRSNPKQVDLFPALGTTMKVEDSATIWGADCCYEGLSLDAGRKTLVLIPGTEKERERERPLPPAAAVT